MVSTGVSMAILPWMCPISSDLGSKAGSGLVSTWIGEHRGLRKQRRDRKCSEQGAVREGFPREDACAETWRSQVKRKRKAKGNRCGSDTQPHPNQKYADQNGEGPFYTHQIVNVKVE